MRVAELFQLVDRRSRCAALDFDAVALHQGNILVDGLIGDAERGDDVARHAAELRFTLKNRRLNARAAEEIGCCNARRAAADDGRLLARDLGRGLDGGHQRAVAAFSGDELCVSDLDGFFVEVAGALRLAAVRADRAGDERQRVLLGDEL